jgi:hypothetical protein
VDRLPIPGDVLCFKTKSSGHLAILVSDTDMVHCRQKSGKVMRQEVGRSWRRMCNSVWEMRS